jgi:purine-binding chemotaxis protein CheW
VAAAGDAQSEFTRQLIVFSLHGERYGLPIGSVREIVRYTPPRVTAAARGLIQGLINLRGRVLPVVDLSSRLGQVLEVSDATRILVIEVTTGVLGLVVDAVDGVEQVDANRIEPIPGAGGEDALGDEIAAIDDQLVMLIDPERALGRLLPGVPTEGADSAGGADSADGADSAARTPDPEPTRAPRPSAPPPARRRSAATPQIPRSRRRPGHTKDDEE